MSPQVASPPSEKHAAPLATEHPSIIVEVLPEGGYVRDAEPMNLSPDQARAFSPKLLEGMEREPPDGPDTIHHKALAEWHTRLSRFAASIGAVGHVREPGPPDMSSGLGVEAYRDNLETWRRQLAEFATQPQAKAIRGQRVHGRSHRPLGFYRVVGPLVMSAPVVTGNKDDMPGTAWEGPYPSLEQAKEAP